MVQLIYAVLYHQNSNTCFFIKLHQKLHKALHALRIHLAHRLIENQQPRTGNQNRSQGQALTLTTAELVNAVALEAVQPHHRQGFANLTSDKLRLLALIFQRKANLVRHRHRKKLVIRRLINSAHQHTDFLRRPCRHILACKIYPALQLTALLTAQKTADRLNQRRLAAAAASGQQQHLAVVKIQIDMLQGILLPRLVAIG